MSSSSSAPGGSREERTYSSLRPLKRIIAHFEEKLNSRSTDDRRNKKSVSNYNPPTIPNKPIVTKRPKSVRPKTSVNRLSVLPEDEIKINHRPRRSTWSRPLDSISFTSEPGMNRESRDVDTMSLGEVGRHSDLDTVSLASSGTMTSEMYDVTHTRDQHQQQGYSSLQRHHQPSNGRRPPRRHTLTGEQPWSNGPNPRLESASFAPASGFPSDYEQPLHGVISTNEAEKKRLAFLRFLQQRYPQHADVIAGREMKQEQQQHPAFFHTVRSRASYAADSSRASVAFTSSSNDSYGGLEGGGGYTYHHSLSRGGRLRSSLPIVRSRSRSRERPLGLIYLEYSGESRVALLPNEVTSLDTIRALFVQAYPGLLTMPMLDAQRHSILIKHKKTGNYDEIDSVSRIKDRSVIRARPNGLSGIPLPGSKKSPAHQNKPSPATNGSAHNRNNNSRSTLDDVAERNQRNQQKSGLRAPVKSLIRQYQPGAARAPEKAPSKLPLNGGKAPKGKAPSPPPRSAKPVAVESSAKEDNPPASPGGTLQGGNGLGGGSVPQKGFSYIRSGSESTDAGSDEPRSLSPPAHEEKQRSLPAPQVQAKPSSDGSSLGRPKTPVQEHHTRLPQAASTKPGIPRAFGVKSPAQGSRIPAKREPEAPLCDATNQPVTYSNIKRPNSPERRATINGTGGSAGYCKGGRSFRGQQLKAVGIPQVPDVEQGARNHGNAKPEVTPKPAVAPKPSPKRELATANRTAQSHANTPPAPVAPLPKAAAMAPTPNVTSSVDDVSEEGKQKGRKGLFGLKRLVGSRSSGRGRDSASAKQRSQSEERPRQVSIDRPQTLSPPAGRASPAQPDDERKSDKVSPMATRKPALPKTDLLSTLLSNNARQVGKMETGKTPPASVAAAFAVDAESTASSVQSDDDVRDPPSRSNQQAPLAGVLKNGNLVKSTSSSSILSDSACSNLSNTPSLKTKKVSFQDDVTVCDANGISTYSNGLRHSDVDPGASFEQSLSADVSDRDVIEVRAWRDRPSTPFDQKDFQTTAYSPRPSAYQSAVAAAIQSISASSPMLSTNDRPKGATQRYEPFPAAAQGPVIAAKQERHEIPHKEEWSPLRRPLASDVARGGSEVVAQRACTTPLPAMAPKEAAISDVTRDSGPTYFQTDRMTSSHVTGDPFQSDTPPYYECCESSAPPVRPITPSELRNALNQERPPADVEKSYVDPQGGGNNEVLQNVTSLPLNHPGASDSLPTGKPQRPGSDDTTKKRVIAMEKQLASLTGMVESIITSTDKRSPVPGQDASAPLAEEAIEKRPPLIGAMTQDEMKVQLLKLRDTAHDLKQQLVDLKRVQRTSMEHMQEMMNEKTRDLTQFIATTAGAQHRPLRVRRLRLDQERQNYGMSATRTEKQLSDVEAAVEELRNEVVDRRCRVNAREVEALVLQLSQAGRTVAQLKGSFPALCDELRHVAAAESEVIYAEEKFIEAEPTRLDEQLKRCKQLTATLFTLKKLATVQEARSKTPVPTMRPTTPNPLMNRAPGYDDPTMHRGRVMDDVRRVRVDHARRMESIQEAEVCWIRRRKFIREYDAKKFEKSLEMAERALNRTDYVAQNEQRRHMNLVDLYRHRNVAEARQESNLTTSDSSSIESLPPPPPPMEANFTPNAPPNSGPNAPSGLPPPPSNLALPSSAPTDGYVVISPDGGYTSAGPSPDRHRPSPHMGSLPRYADPSQRSRAHGGPGQPLARSHSNYVRVQDAYGGPQGGRHTPLHMVERSRSVTPQHWAARPTTPHQFMNEATQVHYDASDDERQRAEKSQRLKEQYSKLQMMQRKQRLVEKKQVTVPKHKQQSSIPSYQPINTQAKSSDV